MIKFARSFLQKRRQNTSRHIDLDFEDSPFGVVFVEAKNGRFKRVNGVFANLMGRSADQLVGVRWSDLSPLALQKTPVYAEQGPNHSRPSPDTWVQSFLTEPGKSVVAEVSCLTSMKDSQDELLWIYIVKDLADKIDAQTQLRVSEQRHRVVADSARDVIWSMSALGEITYVSPAVEKLRGVTPAEAMQMPLHETLTPPSAEVSIAYFQQVAKAVQCGKTPDSFQGELEYFRKDGSTFWTECLSFPLMDASGNLVEIVGVTRDISERKHYEECLLQARIERCTGHQAVVEEGLALAIRGSLECRNRCFRVRQIRAQRLQLFQQRGRGLTLGVQADCDGHELLLNCLVAGLDEDFGDMGCKSARRSECTHHGLRTDQTHRAQLLRQLGRKCIAQLLERFGWQLFNKEFYEQIFGCHDAVHFFHCTCSTHSRGAMRKPRSCRLS